MLLTWSLTDSLFVIVTPSILIVDTRRMSGSGDGWVSWHFLFLSMITISADLPRLRVRLLTFAHSSILSNSRVRLATLLAGTMRYVSSAYLASEFPAMTGMRSAALTTKEAGPIAMSEVDLSRLASRSRVLQSVSRLTTI